MHVALLTGGAEFKRSTSFAEKLSLLNVFKVITPSVCSSLKMTPFTVSVFRGTSPPHISLPLLVYKVTLPSYALVIPT